MHITTDNEFVLVSSAVQWTTSETLPDGSDITACTSQDVSLAWNYSLLAEEHIVNVEWHYLDNYGVCVCVCVCMCVCVCVCMCVCVLSLIHI